MSHEYFLLREFLNVKFTYPGISGIEPPLFPHDRKFDIFIFMLIHDFKIKHLHISFNIGRIIEINIISKLQNAERRLLWFQEVLL